MTQNIAYHNIQFVQFVKRTHKNNSIHILTYVAVRETDNRTHFSFYNTFYSITLLTSLWLGTCISPNKVQFPDMINAQDCFSTKA